jgi:HlyD family secretion protein
MKNAHSAAFLGLLIGLTIAGCTSPTPPPKPTPTAAAANRATISGASVTATGKVVPVKGAVLSMSTGGVVSEVLVKEGDHVDANQVILRLSAVQEKAAVAQAHAKLTQSIALRDSAVATRNNPQELDSRIAQAEGQVNTAKYQVDAARANATSAETQKDAVGGMAISPAQKVLMNNWYAAQSQLAAAQATYDGAQRNLEVLRDMRAHPIALDAQVQSAESAVHVAQADLDSSNAALAATELHAPFAGTLASVDVNPGELVTSTLPVARIADFSNWQVETTDLTELNIVNIREGDLASLTFDAIPAVELSGKVSKIKPYGNTKQGDIVYTVVVTLDQQDARLRWNMTAKVTISTKQ